MFYGSNVKRASIYVVDGSRSDVSYYYYWLCYTCKLTMLGLLGKHGANHI